MISEKKKIIADCLYFLYYIYVTVEVRNNDG